MDSQYQGCQGCRGSQGSQSTGEERRYLHCPPERRGPHAIVNFLDVDYALLS